MGMDKSAFKWQSFDQADKQLEYWRSQSLNERLRASIEMTKVAYQLVGSDFPPMEKKLVSHKKRNG